MIRTYSELAKLKTFYERYEYLKLTNVVGDKTFGYDRYLNQALYHSTMWRSLRDTIIIRDEGCDLGVPGYEITDMIVIHHMNPITPEQLEHGDPVVFDPRGLICTSHRTHQAIHYGDKSLLPKPIVERKPGDTTLW
jgi:hypothetical protein